VGAGATRHLTQMSRFSTPPLPVRGSGRIGTPRRFWFFFRKKEQSFIKNNHKLKFQKILLKTFLFKKDLAKYSTFIC
jgi:hypothetical protein